MVLLKNNSEWFGLVCLPGGDGRVGGSDGLHHKGGGAAGRSHPDPPARQHLCLHRGDGGIKLELKGIRKGVQGRGREQKRGVLGRESLFFTQRVERAPNMVMEPGAATAPPPWPRFGPLGRYARARMTAPPAWPRLLEVQQFAAARDAEVT